jgi:hypothetical protein
VTKLESLTTKIAEACEAGDLQPVHDELHEVGHLLEGWDSMVDKFELSDQQSTEAKGLGEALFNRFMKLDDSLHGGEEVDLEKFAEGLQTEIGKIQTLHSSDSE